MPCKPTFENGKKKRNRISWNDDNFACSMQDLIKVNSWYFSHNIYLPEHSFRNPEIKSNANTYEFLEKLQRKALRERSKSENLYLSESTCSTYGFKCF